MAKHVTVIKLTVVVICLLLISTIFSSLLSINGVYSWFSEGKEFLMTLQDGITFHTPFPNWPCQVYCL